MNLSVEECQRRWRLLRDKFVRELKKVKEKKSGGPGPAYVLCWPYYKNILFLQETVKHKSENVAL